MSLPASHKPSANSRNALSLVSAVQSFIANGKYLEAIDLTRQLKRGFPHDTFVIALNVQAEKLHLAKGEEETAALLRSIVPIIEKVKETIRTQISAASGEGNDAETQRRQALLQVKAQYRSHAEEHLKLGDFDSAIAEMQRILMLDPGDIAASAFITKVAELKAARAGDATDLQSTIQYEPLPASLTELISESSTDFDSILAKAAPKPDSNSVGTKSDPGKRENSSAPPHSKGNSRTQLLVGSAFFIILAIVVSYFLTRANDQEQNLPQHNTQAQNTNLVERVDTKQRKNSGSEIAMDNSASDDKQNDNGVAPASDSTNTHGGTE